MEAGASQATDPVCGMSVLTDGPHQAEFAGTPYHFCGARCKERFERDPAGTLAARDAPPDPADDRIHTCPMHPEIRQIGPGACPLCGMALEPAEITADAPPNPELLDFTRRLRWSTALTLPVFALAMGEMIPGRPFDRWLAPALQPWLQLALATPVVAGCGSVFFRRGWTSLRTRQLNMFTLVAIGTGVAWLASAIAVLAPGLFPESFRNADGSVPIYFESAAVIVTLVLLGQVLELRAREQTGSAIRSLLRLAPETALRIDENGRDVELPLDQVSVGDQLRVRPGDRVPLDGTVLEGESAVDEAMVTGEPIPVAKGPGDPVIGGTVNGTGAFVMRTEHVGSETLLARIVARVAEAQRSRAPAQQLADRVAAVFVPAVLAIAALAFGTWWAFGPEPRLAHALLSAVSVLIIACPCALGLATPMSIMVAMGRGARAGVLFRNAEALERLRTVDTLVVDKTGTLTEGHPVVTEIVAVGDTSVADWLGLAASLEGSSAHPLATAVVRAARDRGLTLHEPRAFESVTGGGVHGDVEGHDVAIGRLSLLAERGVETEAGADAAHTLGESGHTIIGVALDGALVGLLALADPIKQTAVRALAELPEGVTVVMATGDSAEAAGFVARELGIERVLASQLPDDKHELVRSLQAEGHVVAMAGDGVNDAPALAQADVGIAMGTGSDVALESAAVTLVGGDLAGVVRAWRISRDTTRNLRQNLAFAFGYNALGVPIAAGILFPWTGLMLSPMIAAAAMSLSSVSVIANASRLRLAR